eukprot:6972927-Prorocentrum_lima.AAC.1
MCDKYTKRHISRTKEAFEVVYPAVWEHYRTWGRWPMCEDDDFSDMEDEGAKQSKRKAQEDLEAEAHAPGSKTEQNRRKRERARTAKAKQAARQAASPPAPRTGP